MKKTAFSIVIKVKNLPVCKAFYRDILELGEPVLDSSFRVEFKIGDSFSLILEKNPWDVPLPPVSGRMSWLFWVGNAEKIRQKMHACGYPVPRLAHTTDQTDSAFFRFTDPEGNPFYISDQSDNN